MAANTGEPLDVLAKRIRALIGLSQDKFGSAVQCMIEAKGRLDAGEQEGWTWHQWRTVHIDTMMPWNEVKKRLGYSSVRNLISSDDARLLGVNTEARTSIGTRATTRAGRKTGKPRGQPKGVAARMAENIGVAKSTITRARKEPETWRQEFTRLWKRSTATDRSWARVEMKI